MHGLYWLAANLAARRPTALVIDDLHWADASSLRWLSFLSRRLEGLPLLVVLGMRPPEQSVETELLTELISDPTVLVIRPTALSEDAVAAMVVQEYGREPEPEFAAACHSATGGNPLFVRALVAALHGEGVEPVAENARRAHEIGPEPVARAVALRLSRLPEEARRFATAAAVLGDGAELRDVAALAGIEDNQLATLAATALARGELLRVTTPTVEFSHPVVRAAVYESIEPAQRLLAHRRAAELLAAGGAEPERVAAHLDLVPPAGRPLRGRHAARRRRPRARPRRARGRGPPPAARAGRAAVGRDAGRHARRARPGGAARGRPGRRRAPAAGAVARSTSRCATRGSGCSSGARSSASTAARRR